MKNEILLEAVDLAVRPLGAPRVLVALDRLELRRGKVLAIVGESGAGKSSLARALVALDRLERGQVRFDSAIIASAVAGAALKAAELRRLRRRFQLVFQDPASSLDPRMTLGESVAEGAVFHGLWTRKEAARRTAELLAELGLDSQLLGRFPAELSGGQRRRAALARVLAVEPELLVLDEITSGLDADRAGQVLDLLLSVGRRSDRALVLIGHDLALLEGRVDEVLVLRAGAEVERGPAAELFQTPRESYTRSLLAASRGDSAWIAADGTKEA